MKRTVCAVIMYFEDKDETGVSLYYADEKSDFYDRATSGHHLEMFSQFFKERGYEKRDGDASFVYYEKTS